MMWIVLIFSSNANSSHKEAMLHSFEDNEAVIKMIIKERSPTMRHVSRTLRVALDWLFDRINLDTKIQIKYIDTKNQLADILTKGNFTRDEWNRLLCLFNISHFCEQYTSHVVFSQWITCTRMAQVWVRTHHSHASCALWSLCLIALSSTTPFSSPSSPSSFLSPCPSFCPSTSSSRMWYTTSLCTPAEDLGTLAENEPPTCYEPNEYHITEACVDYTQESSVEQRSPNDFDYDDVTIGKALSDACRRRADHSQEEGLSSCLSSVSHDRTGRPVVKPFDSQISSVQEIHRHSSESEQIRILLERQREQILADCQAEIRKHEFQADYARRSIQKLIETIESQQEELHRAQAEERRRQDHQLLHEQLLKQNWDLREAHEKSLSEMEELKRFQG